MICYVRAHFRARFCCLDGAGERLLMQTLLTFVFSASCVAVPTLIGSEKFGNVLLTVASTAGVWMNLLLPALILYLRGPQVGNGEHREQARSLWLVKVGWILFLESLCLVDGMIKMMEPQPAQKQSILSEECRKVERCTTELSMNRSSTLGFYKVE